MARTEQRALLPAALLALLLVAGCAGRAPTAPAPAGTPTKTQLPVPREEPRSRYGNGPVYEVFGREYEVLDSSYGYRERGVASWYGEKFHGRLTSSREPYDMYAMTAAHKSLPLPTWVEVRNLSNGRKVVVRVNDRGPFVKNRLIDLSYAAASRLGIVADGTGMVEVTAISFDEPPPTPAATGRPAPAAGGDRGAAATPAAASQETSAEDRPRLFVQVGAFGEETNAERRHRLLADNGIPGVFVQKAVDRSPAVYRVRIGPLSGVDDYDRVVEKLSHIGIADSHLVTE